MAYDTLDGEARTIAGAVSAQDQETKDFLALARERFKLAATAENKYRKDALEDLRFLVGNQWPGETATQRSEENRPCLTINRMPAIKSQIVNEQRAQRPQTVVKPVGDGADVDTAEMWTGIVRHIFVNSDAEVAIDCGFEHMVAAGKGYCEIATRYLPGRTFDQEIYIDRIKNPFTVYCDPASILPDETDANWKFKTVDYPFMEYKQLFPESQLATLNDFTAIGDNFPGWGDNKTIRVAEYWHKEWESTDLYHLENGQIMTRERYNAMVKDMEPELKPKIAKKRKWRQCTIKCDVINGIETLESYTFPGTVGYIPLIPFIAEDFDVDGERFLYGIIRNAKDAQRSINYFRSYAAEVIALAPKAPWVGWKGQFKDGKWQNANIVNYAYLEADMVTTSGQAAPSLPTRNQFEPPIQAILAMSMAVDQDLKSVTGIYEPSLGQTKTDQSGKAIDLLQKQGGLTNLNFTDNLSRTLRHIGRVILDVAPFIYDAPRVQRIIRPDGTTNHVIVHSGRPPQAAEALMGDDVKQIYDLNVGTYDVVIDVGPSYATKRQEAFNMQIQLAQADKSGEILKTCLDLIVANSDAPGAQEMAKRLKKLVPPQVLDDDGTDPQTTIMKLTGQVQQAQQVNQQLMQHNQEMMDEIKTQKVQADNKMAIAQLQTAAQIEVAGINAKLDMAKLDFQKWELGHTSAHDLAINVGQQQHEKELAAQQTQADAQQQQQQQAHESTENEADRQAAQEQQNAGNASGGAGEAGSSTGS